MREGGSKLLRQEVNELTELVRHDAGWADLKQALESKGLNLNRLLLVGFMENEKGGEWGAVVTDKLQIFEFRRNMSTGERFTKWREVKDIEELKDSFAAASVGLDMARRSLKAD